MCDPNPRFARVSLVFFFKLEPHIELLLYFYWKHDFWDIWNTTFHIKKNSLKNIFSKFPKTFFKNFSFRKFSGKKYIFRQNNFRSHFFSKKKIDEKKWLFRKNLTKNNFGQLFFDENFSTKILIFLKIENFKIDFRSTLCQGGHSGYTLCMGYQDIRGGLGDPLESSE